MSIFGNPGIINPMVWSTFGISAKEQDSAIGKFGTGLKYAISVLLREGRNIRIEAGGEVYNFTTESTSFRGKDFERCLCNGQPLPFTTELGKSWELWQAYREIASNCLDENGVIGEAGETTIYAELDDIPHDSVFLSRHSAPLYEDAYCRVYAGKSNKIYYRGAVAADGEDCFFTIDMKEADLTEDRTFKYMHQVREAVARAFVYNDNIQFSGDALNKTKGFFEENALFDYLNTPPKAHVMNMVAGMMKQAFWKHAGIVDFVKKHSGNREHDIQELNDRQKMIVSIASEFLAEHCDRPITHPVFLSDSLGSGVLATAELQRRRILLSPRVLTQGVKQVASTLYEEELHLSEGLMDKTYEMQSYLFDQIITMAEKLSGRVL